MLIEQQVGERAYFRISPSYALKQDPEYGLVLVGDDVLKINTSSPNVLLALEKLKNPAGISLEELSSVVGNISLASKMLSNLDSLGVIQYNCENFPASLTSGTEAYLDSTLKYPAKLINKNDICIAVIGCGAIGGLVAYQLAMSGIGKLLLVDYDIVENSNLNRQLQFSMSDIGREKTDALADRIKSTSKNVDVDICNMKIQTSADLEAISQHKPDALVCAADTPPIEIEILLSSFCLQNSIIFSTAGVGIQKGFWGPIMPRDSNKDYSAWLKKRTENRDTLSTPQQSFAPTNLIVAGALCRDLIHFILGDKVQTLEKRVELDFSTFSTSSIPIE